MLSAANFAWRFKGEYISNLAQVIASAITINVNTHANTLIPGFSVHSGLLHFSAGVCISTDRKDEIHLFTVKRTGLLGCTRRTD